MSTAIPQIPPRPQRTTSDQPSGSSMGIPKIPPRPIRKIDRSVSPHRESFARSPLNEYPPRSPLYQGGLASPSALDLPARPPSVVLPSLGQEGIEYADVISIDPPEATNVVNDLELHAPKPSLPISSAKKRLSTVTRTDSDKATSFGIGKARSSDGTSGSDDKDPSSRSLKKKDSQTSFNTERRPSSVESDHGIPEIGQRVPMYPNAGDVQAPSPAPFATPYAPGIGFHNDGSKPKHHSRKLSARGEIPADAYGRYGHGVPHQNDHFEKAYYEKHPELFKKELGQYGEGRPEWALSSDDLNKIVRNTASRGAGVGTSHAAFGTPTEEIGFQATEEYTSRISSPRPQSSLQVAHASTSATHTDSPLRKESFPADGGAKTEIESAVRNGLRRPSGLGQDSEVEDEDTIHVEDPSLRLNKVYSSNSRFESTEDLRNHSGDDLDRIQEEHGYSAPILASDEVAKEPWGYELQPAVSPLHDRKFGHYDEPYHTRSGSDSMSNSRPSSRPGSIHGPIPGLRVQDSTPLEDLAEYEPLFPEDEKTSVQKKPVTAAERVRIRPELKNRKFPSQDIWEDTPNSLQYTATVSTPQAVDETDEAKAQASRTETPEQAFARRQEELAEKESLNSESFLRREQKKKPWAFDPEERNERSNVKQRFPGRDIWEDSPDSLQLETTVSAPQSDESIVSPPDERPTTGAAVFHHERDAAGIPLSSDEGRATTGIAATFKPHVPARPVRSKLSESPEKTYPVIPGRPDRSKQVPVIDLTGPPPPLKSKPQVPARPSKPIARESSEAVPLAKVTSNTSTKSVGSDHGVAAASKPKPPVPSRPVGSKIAALQGGFMSDLNKRLQLGPQAPKKDEPVVIEPEEVQEKAPLVDARKGRARGPARRAPAKSPTPAAEPTPEKASVILGFSVPLTLWEIDPEENTLQVASSGLDEIAQPTTDTKSTPSEEPTPAINTADEPVEETPEVTKSVGESSLLPSESKEDVKEIEKSVPAVEDTSNEVDPVKPKEEALEIADKAKEIEPEPIVTKGALEPQPDVAEEDDLTASTATIKPTPAAT